MIDYIIGNLNRSREGMCDIPGVELIEPEGTFLLWLDFRGLVLAPDDLMRFLRNEVGWAITREIAFDPAGSGFGRLKIACPRAQLDDALQRLLQAVNEL